MKQFAVAVFLAAGLILVGCGSNSSAPSNVNGTWNATLSDSNNAPVFTLGTSFVENSDNTLSVTNLSITLPSASPSPCFTSGQTATGSFMLSGNFNGNMNGTFGLVVKSGSPAGNTLTLNGTAAGNTISGTWTLAGGLGCTGNGTFTMTKM